MMDLLTVSASDLATALRRREITSVDLVRAHIGHARKVNPVLNAIVKDRYEQALRDAQAADARLASEDPAELPPFLGVPCTIKESCRLDGMPLSSGLVARRHVIAEGDSTCTARLRAAGAIPLGVTNISELCMWMESNNRVYGRTNNPYDPGRIVGGSSGGEGAIVGSGASPFGLGSDIGGSIRMPAFFNGVFGHKASGGLIPGTGQYPDAHGPAKRYLCTGPLTRRAADLWPLVQTLAGPDGQDTGCQPMTLGDPYSVDWKQMQVINIEDNGVVDVSPDLRAAQAKAADAFRRAGAQVKTVRVDGLRYSLQIWSCMLHLAGGPSFSRLLGEGKRLYPGLEFLKWCVGASDHTLPAIGLAIFEKIPDLMPARTRRFAGMGLALREELTQVIGPQGIMLYPSYPAPAPRHYEPVYRMTFKWVYTAILNMMEFPATQIPLGLNAEGLPLGVQAASTHGNDHLTVAAALLLEKEFGGWTPPRLLSGKQT